LEKIIESYVIISKASIELFIEIWWPNRSSTKNW